MIEIKYITGYSPKQKSIYRYLLIPTRRICGDLCRYYFYSGIGERNIRGIDNVRLDFHSRYERVFKRLSISFLLNKYKPFLLPRLNNKQFDLSCGCKILKEELILISNKRFRQIAFSLIYMTPTTTRDKAEIYLKEQEYLQELLNYYPDEN